MSVQRYGHIVVSLFVGSLQRRRFLAWKAVYLLLATAVLFVTLHHRAYDDPFITYRYAANLHQGTGFVYNAGERIQSTTTPLFALLLAGLATLWGNLPYLANLIGAFSLAVGGLLLWELAATWKAPWAGWAGLLLYPLFPLAITTLGSETPLYIAFCLAAFVAYFRRRYTITAACAALAALTRPDGILVSLVLAGDFAWQLYRAKKPVRPIGDIKHRGNIKHRGDTVQGGESEDDGDRATAAIPLHTVIPWRAVGLFLGLLLPWFLFAWVYFGSPLPVTLAAKQQQGAMAVSQRFAAGFLSILGWYKSWRYILEAFFALVGLVFVIRPARGDKDHRGDNGGPRSPHPIQWLRFLAWPALYFAAFSLLGVSRYFWYYTPLVPGFLLLSGLGLQALAGINTFLPAGFQFRASQFLSFILLMVLCVAQASALARLQSPDPRYTIYRAAGSWLAANTPPNASVGALEVGILGYYSHRTMVDFTGLIQPRVAAQLTGGVNYEYAAQWAVEHYRPGYLVLFRGDFVQLEQGYVAQHCRMVKKFNGNQDDNGPNSSPLKNLLIYNCQ